jgi:large subunit ribosomal protein L25
MDTIQIKAERRTLGSKGQLNQMRRDGKVPAVLHNHGGESLHLALPLADIKRALGTPAGMNTLLSVEYEGNKQLAMFESLERNPLKAGTYRHANLTRISMEGPIEVKVPVVMLGADKRASSNGLAALLMHEIPISTSPDFIPEQFAFDVSTLMPGEGIFIRDVPMPEGCTTPAHPDDLVIHIVPPKGGESDTVSESESAESAQT